eukprot:1175774-Rhodomonas_salina.2
MHAPLQAGQVERATQSSELRVASGCVHTDAILLLTSSSYQGWAGGTRKIGDPLRLWICDASSQLRLLCAVLCLKKGIPSLCCCMFLGCNCIRLGLASLIGLAYAGVAPCIIAYRQLNCRSYGARLRLIASLC